MESFASGRSEKTARGAKVAR
ncbi:hypothetical protein Zm00014a_027043 [Zea mays]|uniref:Uncharacterized protein n=1 Tax=Zea mays TaxID=4577 RepID=A0A3L6DUP3_MAIZE|nr:hypothetical protein Zm00014a_027043 [Zea mays]